MNILLHYRYFDKRFEKDIIEELNKTYKFNKYVLIEGRIWDGIRRINNCVYIPDDNDFIESFDINKLEPLSRQFFEAYTKYAFPFMNLLNRESFFDVFNYETAKEKLLVYARFWNTILKTEKIQYIHFRFTPHKIEDYSLYAVARVLGIPLTVFFGGKWGDSIGGICKNVEDEFNRIITQNKDIVLNGYWADFYRKHRNRKAQELMVTCKTEKAERKSLIKLSKYIFSFNYFRATYGRCFKLLVKGMKENNVSLKNYAYSKYKFTVKIRTKSLIAFICAKGVNYYNRIAEMPDYKRPYIYCALQTVPELAVTPLAGTFDNQLLELHILSQCGKQCNLDIYVKEHPLQPWRSKKFYQNILQLENVKLIKTTTNTYELIENAVATATFTGSCALEGVLRNVPALIFSRNSHRALPGSFYITDLESCCKSIECILKKEVKFDDYTLKAYFKALEITEQDTYCTIGSKYNIGSTEYTNKVRAHVCFILGRLNYYRLIPEKNS